MDDNRFGKVFLLLLVVSISALFVAMIRSFLLTILFAAIFSGLAFPLYRRLVGLFRGRRAVASVTTVILLLIVVVAPLLGVLGIVAGEALGVSETVSPWIKARLAEPGTFDEYFEQIPGYQRLEPFREQIITKAGELVGSASTFLFNSLSATTRGTVTFLFQFFVLLYCMFFFLMDGGPLLRKILYYMPLNNEDEERMVEKFTSVARATIKGTLLIGLAQGTLAGFAFWVAGISGAVFWGTLMVLLSIVPGIGIGLVYIPAALILIFSGHVLKGILLGLFCALVVGSIDNLLRPRLVGRDTKMHDLMILFGTMGGILLFGVLGFIVGPIVAALFVTVWDIYGSVFRDVLPVGRPEGGAE
ncbi:MAG: AI-2E family transporter [bacterium]